MTQLSPFPLRNFRAERGLSLDDVSACLGVHKTTVMRIEAGELPVDADMVERIELMTGGSVSASAMHAVRLDWLRKNRPERFRVSDASDDSHARELAQ